MTYMEGKAKLRAMQDKIRTLMVELDAIGQSGLNATDEAMIDALYEDTRRLFTKLGETARTLKA